MTRSRASAKAAGTRFESSVAGFLAERLGDDRIERRARNGAFDRGDITGVRAVSGARVTIEAKDYGGKYLVSPWLTEARVEAANDDSPIGVVVAKRRGITDPAEQVVFMTLETLCLLIEGGLPNTP